MIPPIQGFFGPDGAGAMRSEASELSDSVVLNHPFPLLPRNHFGILKNSRVFDKREEFDSRVAMCALLAKRVAPRVQELYLNLIATVVDHQSGWSCAQRKKMKSRPER